MDSFASDSARLVNDTFKSSFCRGVVCVERGCLGTMTLTPGLIKQR